MEQRPTLSANAVISLLAGAWVVLRTSAAFFALWLSKLACQKLHNPNIGTFIGICIGGAIWKCVDRLLFHPLSGFPGPKLAALTHNYEFYYDVILGGQYTFLLKALHDKYGPIIRISPYELHVIDPEFHEQLYSGHGNPRDKYPFVTHSVGETTSVFATISHEKHRQRRAPLNALFSKKSVGELSSTILERVEKLCQRITEFRASQKPLSLKHAYSSLTLDVISGYSFGKSQRALDSPDFEKVLIDGFDEAADGLWLMEFCPPIRALMRQIPPSWGWLLGPGVDALMKVQSYLEVQVREVQKERVQEKKEERRTVFNEMLDSPDLPPEDRSTFNLVNQAQVIIGAGITTSAAHLANTTFHILNNPRILKKLQQELNEAIPDPSTLAPLASLEKLEYLNAVVAEGHRLSHGVVHRMPRISPYTPIKYGDWTIPAGLPVGMSALHIHLNEEIFPSPNEFQPERFLGEEGQKRKKYVVPFSKGTRRCLGENLATAELYLTLAAVFRRFNLELFETTREDDIDMAREYMIPFPKKGSQGLRVLVK
ncbi:hypothetical protein M409DRAFT_70493 [Zasmidium cellare ATCC 36951]|uniref:Cytochrome P450 n=1 Tax=Zasmidium cellare ATCC 36951 TaxID=1080233 RepID=A0A6A6C4L4_ZASCE|nr:uncharacterized protein M409DRAFT_70493 [Zasmidium cellare ATCC 36951]KAF2160316.1 hypothetical protein M409DRAFT_70493 [Zasmidium cellare ATCC 36951]